MNSMEKVGVILYRSGWSIVALVLALEAFLLLEKAIGGPDMEELYEQYWLPKLIVGLVAVLVAVVGHVVKKVGAEG